MAGGTAHSHDIYGIISVSLKGDADQNPANHEHHSFAWRPVKFCFREQVLTWRVVVRLTEVRRWETIEEYASFQGRDTVN